MTRDCVNDNSRNEEKLIIDILGVDIPNSQLLLQYEIAHKFIK
jgi:hypothetical protein